MSDTATQPLKRTPFYQYHVESGARFVGFAGWEMPIHFGSILDEHRHTRTSGGLFDVSHMGRIKFSGRHARRFLERIVTRRVSDMKEKTCRYAMICRADGGVLDDVIVYRFAEHWMLVVNASNRIKVLEHMKANLGDLSVKIDDLTENTAMVAVQGPKVMEMIGNFSKEVPTLNRYTFCEKNLLVLKMTISRTGYSGEDGVEVILPAGMATMAIKLLVREKAGEAKTLRPAGLGARDTLRMEAGMPLYGHELDEQTDPLSAGLAFAVSLDKHTFNDGGTPERFIGQDALERIAAAGPSKKLIGLKMDGKRSPRQGMAVLSKDGEKALGAVTSGCLSPTLGYPIAMAYVPPEAAEVGGELLVDLGREKAAAQVVKLPFYKR